MKNESKTLTQSSHNKTRIVCTRSPRCSIHWEAHQLQTSHEHATSNHLSVVQFSPCFLLPLSFCAFRADRVKAGWQWRCIGSWKKKEKCRGCLCGWFGSDEFNVALEEETAVVSTLPTQQNKPAQNKAKEGEVSKSCPVMILPFPHKKSCLIRL